MKQNNSTLTEVVSQQQRFLESLDAEKRACNLIITGLKEDGPLSVEEDSAHTDEEKIVLVLKKIGQENIAPVSVTRLGERRPGLHTRNRPVKVVLHSPGIRKGILSAAARLKQSGPDFARVYIKKDTHPALRKEYDRMRRSEREERNKPENQGKEVRYDRDTRCITVDGIVVDRFKPTFF